MQIVVKNGIQTTFPNIAVAQTFSHIACNLLWGREDLSTTKQNQKQTQSNYGSEKAFASAGYWFGFPKSIRLTRTQFDSIYDSIWWRIFSLRKCLDIFCGWNNVNIKRFICQFRTQKSNIGVINSQKMKVAYLRLLWLQTGWRGKNHRM